LPAREGDESIAAMQKLKGDLYLAYRALFAHPLRQLFSTDQRSGKQRFLDNYAPEGLVPMSAGDRQLLYQASRCIHCGLCEGFDDALSVLPRTTYDGSSLLAICYSRATPDLPRARAALEGLSEAQLVRSEAVCPTRVPLRSLLGYLRRQLDEVVRQQHRPADGVPHF
jgi:succinate dehydrogenase/fumarate reductase-like Fe-S protein